MYSGDVVDFVAFSPRLIAIVTRHHGRRDHTCEPHEYCHYQSNEAEDIMRSHGHLPVHVGIDLTASINRGSSDYKTENVMAVMHEVPIGLVISFCSDESET